MKKILPDQTGDGIKFASKMNGLPRHTCSLERAVSLLTEKKVMQIAGRLAIPI